VRQLCHKCYLIFILLDYVEFKKLNYIYQLKCYKNSAACIKINKVINPTEICEDQLEDETD